MAAAYWGLPALFPALAVPVDVAGWTFLAAVLLVLFPIRAIGLGRKRAALMALVALVLFAHFNEGFERTPEGQAAVAERERQEQERAALASERRQQEEAERRAQLRQEMAQRGLADAHDILLGRGDMRAWHEADQANKTEVAYRLTETMIMRGNVPRSRASFIELYRCLEGAYSVELDSTPVEELASMCAVSMGWVR